MSEKTIADRMYLKTAKSMAIINAEVHPSIAAQMPRELLDAGTDKADVVLLFALSRKDLEQSFPDALARLGDKGSLWIAYLKQTASKATDLTRDNIGAYAKENGATPVAMISVDMDWSALRLKRL